MSNNKTGRTRTKKSSLPSKNISSSPAVAHSGPPMVSTRSFEVNEETNAFADTYYITCSPGSRSFFLAVTQYGKMNCVYGVQITIRETLEGKASTELTVGAGLHQANGASCVTDSELSGAIEVKKRKMSCPPVSDRELVMYKFIDEPHSLSAFSLEKKTKSGFVEKITVTHSFSIGEDAFYYLAIKMVVSNRSAGLLVELEGPEKHTRNFMDQRLFKFIDKASREGQKQCINGLLNGCTSEDMRLDQALGSYVNTGTQSTTGLLNSSGSLKGNGNNSIFNIFNIFNRNGKERARESSSRTYVIS